MKDGKKCTTSTTNQSTTITTMGITVITETTAATTPAYGLSLIVCGLLKGLGNLIDLSISFERAVE
jgi:hypothetical protein